MRIVPHHKSDMVAIENLARATDEEIINEIYELLSWLQDMNWPVAVPICEKIKDLGVPLVEPIE